MPLDTCSFTTDTLVASIAALFALASIIISVMVYYSSSKKESYVIFEKEYTFLLDKIITDPSLGDSKKVKNYDKFENSDSDFFNKYCAYAYMVWNFLETIYDLSNSKKKRKRNLFNTWSPVFKEESELHIRWFLKNKKFFKEEFQNYVISTINKDLLEGKTDN